MVYIYIYIYIYIVLTRIYVSWVLSKCTNTCRLCVCCNPGLRDLIGLIIQASWGKGSPSSDYLGEIQWVVNDRVLHHLIKLSTSEGLTDRVRALVVYDIRGIRNLTQSKAFGGGDKIISSRRYFYQQKIDRFLEDPDRFVDTPSLNVPPGSPIGSHGLVGCGWYE